MYDKLTSKFQCLYSCWLLARPLDHVDLSPGYTRSGKEVRSSRSQADGGPDVQHSDKVCHKLCLVQFRTEKFHAKISKNLYL